MQISSSYGSLYSGVYSQQQEKPTLEENKQELEQNLQKPDQYRTASVTIEERNSRVEAGDKLTEITETKKTVEKYKLDLLA